MCIYAVDREVPSFPVLLCFIIQASAASSVVRTVRGLQRSWTYGSTYSCTIPTTGRSAARSVARSGTARASCDSTWPSTRVNGHISAPNVERHSPTARSYELICEYMWTIGHTSVSIVRNGLCTAAICTNMYGVFTANLIQALLPYPKAVAVLG